MHLPIYRPTGLFRLNGRSDTGLWKSYSEIMRNNLMNANAWKSNKTWQSAPTASANMRSTPGLNIGVFNFGDLGRSGGMGRYKLPKNCPESTELSVFPGLIFRRPCHIIILQEAAGLNLSEYMNEAIDGKIRGVVQSVHKKDIMCHRMKTPGG